jgi:hypothetical protein
MEGLSAQRPRKKPFLSQIHWQRRLAWAVVRKDWDVETWRKYIFTDESTFETGKPDGSILVRCRIGKAYHNDCLLLTFKSGRSTSNHWGGIHYSGRSELVCLRGEGRMNSQKYVELILQDKLLTFYNLVQNGTGQIPVVIEDNATCHTAKVAKVERGQ